MHKHCPCRPFSFASFDMVNMKKVDIFTDYRLYAGLRFGASPCPNYILQYKRDTSLVCMPTMVKRVFCGPTEADFEAALDSFHKEQAGFHTLPNLDESPLAPTKVLHSVSTVETANDESSCGLVPAVLCGVEKPLANTGVAFRHEQIKDTMMGLSGTKVRADFGPEPAVETRRRFCIVVIVLLVGRCRKRRPHDG